jgi:hypothetical protein
MTKLSLPGCCISSFMIDTPSSVTTRCDGQRKSTNENNNQNLVPFCNDSLPFQGDTVQFSFAISETKYQVNKSIVQNLIDIVHYNSKPCNLLLLVTNKHLEGLISKYTKVPLLPLSFQGYPTRHSLGNRQESIPSFESKTRMLLLLCFVTFFFLC